MNTELEEQVKQAKEAIALRDSLFKLYKNKDFIKVISVGYFEKEPVNLAKARPFIMSEDLPQVDDAFKAIGLLNKYFITIERNGSVAESNLEKIEEELQNSSEE